MNVKIKMYSTVIFVVVVGVSIAGGLPSINSRPYKFQQVSSTFDRTKVNADLCTECINEVVVVINVLMNAILDEGIMATCSGLCGFVANKTSSKVLGDLCEVACDAFGVDEFVKALINFDIDPIYYCQLVKLCAVKDDGDAKFVNFAVYPKTGNRTTKFLADCSFSTKNGTGVGTFQVTLINPKGQSVGVQYWFEEKPPGSYTERIPLDAIEENCDPKLGLCDDWPVGNYNVTAEICNGVCGSHHPHTSIYDMGKGSFTVTK